MTTYHGIDAITEVARKYGPRITTEMVEVIKWEGYSDEVYEDTKGIKTTGVGQTGVYAELEFPETFHRKKAELLRYTPQLSTLPPQVQDALLVSNYRGDWAQSPKTRALFDQGLYKEAAEEYLNNAEYKSAHTPYSIKKRFDYVASAIRSMV